MSVGNQDMGMKLSIKVDEMDKCMVVGIDSSMWVSICLRSVMGKMWGENVSVVAAST